MEGSLTMSGDRKTYGNENTDRGGSGRGKIFSRRNLKRAGVAAVLLGLLGGGGWFLAGSGALEGIAGA